VAGRRGAKDGRRGLPRGPQALPREEVAAHQRKRLFEALLALVNERGFAGVTISELVRSAGISRRSFYEHFENKEQCLLAAFDDSIELLARRIAEGFDPGEGWNGQIEGILRALFDATAERPQAARLVCVEVSAAGPEGVERWAQGAARLEGVLEVMFEQAPGPGTIPEPVAKAVVGALRKILYARVLSAKPGRGLRTELNRALPGLVGWIAGYYPSPPGVPHRPRRRKVARSTHGRAPGSLVSVSGAGARALPRGLPGGEHNLPRGFVEHNQRERIFDAIANLTAARGYPAVGLEDIAAEAAISLRTFYSHFESKEEAFIATYELGHARAVAVCVEAFAAQPTWPEGVHVGVRALLEFLAAEPSYAHMACMDAATAFPELTERVQRANAAYAELLEFGIAQAAGAASGPTGGRAATRASKDVKPSRIVGEAIVGGVFELLLDYIARGLTARLPELADHATYIALTPLIGSAAAAELIAPPRARS
jgi:AcrR family transcriptional regulator